MSLPMQSKETNLENQLNVSTESPKEHFNNTVFHHSVDELKFGLCNECMDLNY